MTINVNSQGESVYVHAPTLERAMNPLYRAANDLVIENSRSGLVLDIGCSDGVATYNLPDDYTVFGLDLSQSALSVNRKQQKICADMRQLPFRKDSGIDTVLMLDILEHEQWQDSLGVLETVKEIANEDHSLIVSMPIISGISVETWGELIQVVKNKKRPETGLFDRTHRILRGVKGHLALFAEAGYLPVETHSTNQIEGVTGSWSFKLSAAPEDRPELQGKEGIARAAAVAKLALRPLEGSRRNLLYNETQRSDRPKLSQLGRALFAYQGLYLLKPTDKSRQYQ